MGVAYSVVSVGDAAAVASAMVALVGVIFVYVQLRGTTSASRAQATIQFQRTFRNSSEARGRLLKTFPVHENLIEQLGATELLPEVTTWSELDDLTPEQIADARNVIGAMNDVAQYVADGLQMRSALQQYHTIFVRVGALVLPYLDADSAPRAGRPQSRFGRRMVNLYNAGIAYQVRHPKHRGRELVLERPSTVAGSPDVRLVLLDEQGYGVTRHPGFTDEHGTRPETLQKKIALRRAVRRAERGLRR